MECFKTTQNNYTHKITLKPSVRCDQQCWFCDEYDNNESDWSLEDSENIILKIKEMFSCDDKLFIYLYGGEPLLYKHWENLIFELLDLDLDISIQIQTNLSISNKRLELFYSNISHVDQPRLEFCSSYHLGKQKVNDFVEKLNTLKKFNGLGYCFFNTDVGLETQFKDEFLIVKKVIGNKLKVRFTEADPTNIPNNYPKEAKEFIGKNFDYLYFKDFDYIKDSLEEEFTFSYDNSIYNFSELISKDLNEFKLWKCDCGTQNMVIDNNLNVYYCNDDYTNNHYGIKLKDLNKDFFKLKYCMNDVCHDGLEYRKWK
ncbi:MAG: hypothetical protein DRG78_18070 [Epsilonproteobacteria bacterium]|nr:MAG: hypothetical protein DRG78_18070 [Campylobacterota bacterium]